MVNTWKVPKCLSEDGPSRGRDYAVVKNEGERLPCPDVGRIPSWVVTRGKQGGGGDSTPPSKNRGKPCMSELT